MNFLLEKLVAALVLSPLGIFVSAAIPRPFPSDDALTDHWYIYYEQW
ncbi:MAG TPA: hypothetical protein VGG45_13710 [Terracidiphilus sp.]